MIRRNQKCEIHLSIATIFVVLAASLCVANISLLRENARLVRRQRIQTEVSPGATLAAMRGLLVNGSSAELGYTGPSSWDKTLLLVFSPTCRYCEENWPLWQNVLRQVNPKRVRVAGVNIGPQSGLQQLLSKQNMGGFLMFASVDPGSLKQYHLGVAPQTIAIGLNGRVEHVWTGVLRESQLREIAAWIAEPPNKGAIKTPVDGCTLSELATRRSP